MLCWGSWLYDGVMCACPAPNVIFICLVLWLELLWPCGQMEKLVQLKAEAYWFWPKFAVLLAVVAVAVTKPRN